MLGPTEIVLLVLVIAVFFFGAKKIPELARGIGRAFGEFHRGKREMDDEIRLVSRK